MLDGVGEGFRGRQDYGESLAVVGAAFVEPAPQALA
jgi:hypothetical protein